MKRIVTRAQTKSYRDLGGGMLRKMDTGRLPPKFFRDAANMRFGSGSPETRPGTYRVTKFARPDGALLFPGNTASYVTVPANLGCPLFSGMGPEFTIEYVMRPAAAPVALAYSMIAGVDTVTPAFAIIAPNGFPLRRSIRFTEAGGLDLVEKVIGNLDDAGGGTPADTRYYVRVRRVGTDMDVLLAGGAGGDQYTLYPDAFSSEGIKLEIPTIGDPFFLGGSSVLTGINETIDDLRIWNRYLDDTRRYYWSEYPMAEDPNLLLYLRLNEGSGAIVLDSSLHANHGAVVGSPTRVDGEVEGLMVGQLIEEFSAGTQLQRLAAAGGSFFREAVR